MAERMPCVVEDRHPEPRRAPGDCTPDPPHPDDAQRLAKHVRAKKLRRSPSFPSPFAHQPVSLRNPPHHPQRSEEHTSELQSRLHLVCRLLLEKKKKKECE